MATRREFLGASVAAYAVGTWNALPARAQGPAGVRVLREAVDLGRRLRRREIRQTEWQDQIEALLASTDPGTLSDAIALRRARARTTPVARGSSIRRIENFGELGADDGADVKLFFFEAGRTDPPHCHFNLVAAHVVLEGRFRVRHYERVREEADGVVIRPTHDRTIGPGQVTSISDDRDNAHWHAALTRGVLLDVQQGRIDPSIPIRRRQMLDVERARPLGNGTLLAPKISRAQGYRRYG